MKNLVNKIKNEYSFDKTSIIIKYGNIGEYILSKYESFLLKNNIEYQLFYHNNEYEIFGENLPKINVIDDKSLDIAARMH